MKTDKRGRGREAGVEARAVGKDGGQMELFVPSLFPGHGMIQRVLASPIEAPLPSASLSYFRGQPTGPQVQRIQPKASQENLHFFSFIYSLVHLFIHSNPVIEHLFKPLNIQLRTRHSKGQAGIRKHRVQILLVP